MVEAKAIQTDWILLNYDIPQSQGKLRKSVLKKIAEIGGSMHTASCYLLPYSEDTMDLANEIADGGQVVVWKSKQENVNVAKTLTMKYEAALKFRCVVIEQRMAVIASHIDAGRLGKANRMAEKTHQLLQQVKQIAENYHTDWLPAKIEKLEKELSECYK